MTFAIFGVSIDAKNFKSCKQCGKVIETPPKKGLRQDESDSWGDKFRSATSVEKNWSNISANEDDFDDSRIVNGWKARYNRGFMVLIRNIDPEEPEAYETCAGSLINDRFVLTAGHCVCLAEPHQSNVRCDWETGELQ